MDLYSLQVVCFALTWCFFAAYSVVGGGALGIGFMQIFLSSGEARGRVLRLVVLSHVLGIVFAIIAGMILFFAFPPSFSGAIPKLFPVLCLLVGVSVLLVLLSWLRRLPRFERRWKTIEQGIGVLSFIGAFTIGVLAGNCVAGFPMEVVDTFGVRELLLRSPIPVISGLLAVALFALAGTLRMLPETDGALHTKIIAWLPKIFLLITLLFLFVTAVVFISNPAGTLNIRQNPWLMLLPLVAAGALFLTKIFFTRFDFVAALAGCALSQILLVATVSAGIFPAVIPTAGTAEMLFLISESAKKEILMAISLFLCVAVPVLLAYAYLIYQNFRRKHGIFAKKV